MNFHPSLVGMPPKPDLVDLGTNATIFTSTARLHGTVVHSDYVKGRPRVTVFVQRQGEFMMDDDGSYHDFLLRTNTGWQPIYEDRLTGRWTEDTYGATLLLEGDE